MTGITAMSRPAAHTAECVKAVTLWQPYASFVANGVKTIETRSWRAPKALIGERIAIHAAKKDPGDLAIGEWRIGGTRRSVDRLSGAAVMWREIPGSPYVADQQSLPLGAVVASAILEACIPMVGPTSINDMREWPEPFPPTVLVINGDRMCIADVTRHSFEVREPFDAADSQRPYGDFAPGRWAWLLTDIKPTTERCPACWGAGSVGCICEGHGRRDPVPAKGAQQVWDWNPLADKP